MRTILLASLLSFVAIFGALYVYARQKAQPPSDAPGSALSAENLDAAELSFAALESEREHMNRERARLLLLGNEIAVRQAGLTELQSEIERTIATLREEQIKYGQARSEGAIKLAKMFDAMKADAAAPIFRTLDRDTALEILVRMKEKNAAKLLAALEPATAADLSTKLSLRGLQ